MVSPVADFVVDMGSDGRILSQGSLSSALSKDAKLLKEVEEEQKELEKAEQEIDQEDETEKAGDAQKSSGKLVVAEEVEEGHVGWKASKFVESRCSWLLLSASSSTSRALPWKRIKASRTLLVYLCFRVLRTTPHTECAGESSLTTAT